MTGSDSNHENERTTAHVEKAARKSPAKGGSKDGQAMSPRETELMEQIDKNLQRVYRDTLEEPIPDRFLDLIAELRDKLDTDER